MSHRPRPRRASSARRAAVKLGRSLRDVCAPVDSVSMCLSKGLGAPVGSLVLGSRDFIRQARRTRKILGGGMRQAGVLAAAGLIALHKMTTRLHEDHANACALAEGLATIPHLKIDVSRVKTNMLFFDLAEDAPLKIDALRARLKDDYGVLMGGYAGMPNRIRLVTHYWITPEKVQTALTALRTILAS